MEPVVNCATCGKGYRAIFKESDQAENCAATVSGESITGHYGSTVIDMEIWQFKGDRPETVKDGVICDPCVVALRDAGQIALREAGVW